MLKLPAEILQAFGVPARGLIASGDVYHLGEGHVYYFGDTKPRPAVLVRVQLDAQSRPVLAWLLYTTTGGVPARYGVQLRAGEGGLWEDCRIDLRQHKEIDVASLTADCRMLGRLDEGRCAELEGMLELTQLSKRVRSLPR
jgi:mRNA-degrading endonuclease toxin of MazEF toxin-antitoxin module